MKKIISLTTLIILTIVVLTSCNSAPIDTSTSQEKNNTASKTDDTKTISEDEPTDSADQKEEASMSSNIIEPLQLLSKDDATQLLGEAVTEGAISEQAVVGLKMIMYEAEDEDSFNFIQLSLSQQAYMPDNRQTPESIYASIISAFDGGEKVEGVGERAVFATPGIHIMAKGYYISIGAGNLNDDTVREILRQAGTIAVDNLEKVLQ